jgi:large subunit ribosomal protein L19e
MGLDSQKRIASQLMKCGVSRVRVKDEKQATEALTRNDIRDLIQKGVIVKIQKKGSSKFRWKHKLQQKKRGRKRGFGSRKGTANARKPEKEKWMETVRPLRHVLVNMRENGQIDKKTFREVYMKIKGGMFRSKSHLMLYVKEHELLKTPKPKAVKAGEKLAKKEAKAKAAKKEKAK